MSLDFDGSTYYLGDQLVDLRDPADFTTGIVSGWFRTSTDYTAGVTGFLFGIAASGQSERFSVSISSSDNTLLIRGHDKLGTGGSSILSVQSTAVVNDGSWHHFVMAWDTGDSTKIKLVIDGTEDTQVNFNAATEIDMRGRITLGAQADGTNFFTGQISEIALWHGFYLDPTTAANRRLFLSSEGDTDYLTPGPNSTTRKAVGLGVYGANIGAEAIALVSGEYPVNRVRKPDRLVLQAGSSARSSSNPKVYRQSARKGEGRLGERWFDSEQSGFSYPRSETFIENREGLSSHGKRLGLPEKDDRTRRERPSMTLSQLIISNLDREEDDEEDR